MDPRIRIHTKMSWIRNTAAPGVPLAAEGPRGGGARRGAPGPGDPHAQHAGPHGGRQHHAHPLDQEDHRGGRPHRQPARPHPPAGRQASQGRVGKTPGFFFLTQPSGFFFF
jgi:hypothetical protein